MFNRSGVVVSRSQRASKAAPIKGPAMGWVHTQSMRKNGSAVMLRNFFPTSEGARARGGMKRHALTTEGEAVVYTVVHEGIPSKMFAFNATSIFDVSLPPDANTALTPVHTGLTGQAWASTSFSTPGGTFLICVNGQDEMRQYDGTSWQAINGASTPAITGVDTNTLTQVWKFKNRLFFCAGKSAYYLPVLSIGGAASELPFGGIFQKSGVLLFGATWSLDSGAGLDDMCIFVTIDGEVAVFEGTDPSNVDSWSLAGVYQIAAPMDKEGWFKAGGDLAVLTRDGIVPISQAINLDRSGLAAKAITAPIEDPWRVAMETAAFLQTRLSVRVWPDENMLVIGMPYQFGVGESTFIANLRTGAWAEYSGWVAHALCVFQGRLFAGTPEGRIMELNVQGTDDGAQYQCVCVPNFSDFGGPGEKESLHARCVARTNNAYIIELFGNADFEVNVPPPGQPAPASDNMWDSAIWDAPESMWSSGEGERRVVSEWQNVPAVGFALAPGLSLTCNGVTKPDFEIIGMQFVYAPGQVIG